jgi:hypothetical protein
MDAEKPTRDPLDGRQTARAGFFVSFRPKRRTCVGKGRTNCIPARGRHFFASFCLLLLVLEDDAMVQEVDLCNLRLDDLLFTVDIPEIKLSILRPDDVHILQI